MNTMISSEKCNTSRQLEFDLLKAYTILFMVIIHVYEELCAYPETICDTAYDIILQLLAGPAVAPLFMFAMGIGIVYSKNNEPKLLITRGLKLFVMAYALNIARSTIPTLISGVEASEMLEWIFEVDILHFAGLSLILIGLLKKLKVPEWSMVGIAVIMQAAGNLLSNLWESKGVIGDCIAGLFVYTSDLSCFPLLTWFVYPTLGIVFAIILQYVADKDKFYRKIGFASATFLTGYLITLDLAGIDLRTLFTLYDDMIYRQDCLKMIFSLACIIFMSSLAHFILKSIKSERITNTVKMISTELNHIYIAQWVIIGWLDIVIEDLSVKIAVPFGLVITIVSIVLAWVYSNKIKKHVWRR